MNAKQYLQKQGWRGDGHSLDHTGRGIKKPLLISKKVDVLGVGLNKHAAVSDQWWLRAFDQSLKDFGSGKESMLAAVQKHGVNRYGLYGRFVRGESIAGTFDDTPQTSAPSTPSAEGRIPKKRKRGAEKVAKQVLEMGEPPVDSGAEVHDLPSSVSSAKLKQYRARAEEKGMALEDYMQKREAKNTAKRQEKKRAKETASAIPAKTARRKKS